MSEYSGWFDPICYQFYFYNVNSIGFAPEMNMAYRSFLEEINLVVNIGFLQVKNCY